MHARRVISSIYLEAVLRTSLNRKWNICWLRLYRLAARSSAVIAANRSLITNKSSKEQKRLLDLQV